ncbi:MAG: DUF4834 family protein [Capnocytophaga sp.]|uniref:DUF4834 family protein n=1 Tax=Capnocytophaga sp. oral taxon 863 TaxID=1227265 RepID=UPI000396D047|nr:DUF4834 family protein [Capnocytophaga sp. oral taxon 863]ERI64204.1 hypothetical protein HMPREF1551_00649 [Capnocytophaga sp. oral taxon 863 str. F0517]RKW06692.1 MAG: DUF4834 family protein [Capnocytophaga sp.]
MIQQASFMDFLGMLFTIFLVLACLFWIGMLLIPFALRFLIKRHMNTVEKELFRDAPFQGQSNTQQTYYQSPRNTQAKYSTSGGNQQKKDKKIVGEYIDFEEIE